MSYFFYILSFTQSHLILKRQYTFSIIIFFQNCYYYCFTLLLSTEIRIENVKMSKTINESISFEAGWVLVSTFGGGGRAKIVG